MSKIIFLLLFIPFGIFTQNSQRKFESIRKYDDRVKIIVSDGEYLIGAFSKNIIECSFHPTGMDKKIQSHAVHIFPKENLKLEIHKARNVAYIRNGSNFYVRVQFNPFKLEYVYKQKEILSEGEGYFFKDSMDHIELKILESEKLFGGGARALGMNRRGHCLELYNKAHYGYEEHSNLMNYCIPLFLSDQLYAVHFDNPQIGFLDLDSKSTNRVTYQSIGGRKTYQVIVGDDWKEILKEYTFLTGRQPLPPRWVFGNFASRFGYHSESEARDVVQQYRTDSIPLDAIVFDLYWFGKDIKGHMGNFDFYRDSFPNGEKMIFDFRKEYVKSVFITEPFVLTSSKNWDDAVSSNALAVDTSGDPFTYDFYFGNTGLIDIFNDHGKDWMWSKYKHLIDLGVEGFWGDLGEPEVHPKKLIHKTGKADELHNIYGHEWAKLINDGFEQDYPEKRPFILMRSGYSGSQKYGMIPWSGDVNRSWGGLISQPEICMQMGMQGVAYMHSDLGGFAGAYDDPELYTRWLQYGVFQPIFRPHAQEEVASEPIFKDSITKRRAKEAIELRYKLLPYNYSLAFENHLNGSPLMRPVFYEDTAEHWTDERSDCYMWGPAFFVKPIMSKSKKKHLYFELPKQSTWFDFYTNKKVRVGTKGVSLPNFVSFENTLERIPVFVKSGAFVPMYNSKLPNTELYDSKAVSIHFYYDEVLEKSTGMWYEDDGKTNNSYEEGMFQLIKFGFEKQKKYNEISIHRETTKKYQGVDSFEFILHNQDFIPKKIIMGKEKVDFSINKETESIHIPIHFHSGNKISLKLFH